MQSITVVGADCEVKSVVGIYVDCGPGLVKDETVVVVKSDDGGLETEVDVDF